VIEIRVNNVRASQFTDFLVGAGQPPLAVSLRPLQSGVQVVEWTVAPLGAQSGTVEPSKGTSQEFQFQPNVAAARAQLQTGSTRPNDPVGYRIAVTWKWTQESLVPGAGRTTAQSTATEEIEQDEPSILRQEYVDFGGQPPARDDLTLHQGEFNVGNYRYVVNLEDMQARFDGTVNAYQGRKVTVNNQTVRIPRDAEVRVKSAYRNPRRNVHAGSHFPITSHHVLGRALDLVPVTPVVVTVGKQQVTLDEHDVLYPALWGAASTQGHAIAEQGAIQVQVGSTNEDHIHVQW
jgi:hypothetical protein